MNRRPILFGVFPVLAFASALAGCGGKTQMRLQIRPREVTPDERALAVSRLPEGFREGLTGNGSEIAEQLGLPVWAFDFTGGPFGCWIDIAEEGQQTFPSPHPRNSATRIRCEGEQGVLLFWFLPRTTPQMPQHLKDRFLKNTPEVPDLFVGLATNGDATLNMGRYPGRDKPSVPLWFGWKEAAVRTQAEVALLRPEGSATVLRIEATERGAEGRPRKVTLSLTVVK
jgi:hypothetical protein